MTGLPENIRIVSKDIINDSDATVTSSITLATTAEESWSVSKTKGVDFTKGGSFDMTFAFAQIGTGRASFNFSERVSTSTTTQEGNRSGVTRSTTDTVSIGAHKSIHIELVVYESPAQVPFTVEVVADGDLAENVSGLTKVSQILTEAERTFTIEGVLRIRAVSEGQLSVRNVPNTGAAPEGRIVQVERSHAIYGALSQSYTAQFLPHSKFDRSEKSELIVPLSTPRALLEEDIGAQIGAPDGTHYEVLYTVKEFRPSPACGFNDIGAMNVGVFNVEARRYQTYNNGELAAEWQEKVESFESCWDV